ncbi:MAG: DUF484 family protein [Gammaproteobacteria bacterium]|nr:DUF484 family protein [Gammaproteobacteria bacterium]
MISQTEPEESIDQQVAEHLKANPAFFDQFPEVLRELELPHQTGNAVSLIERQVRTLREESQRYQQQLEELIGVAQANMELNKRLHNLTLTLIDAVTFDEVIDVLQDKLHDDFKAEAVELHLFTIAEADRDTNPDLNGFRDFLDTGKPRCGRLSDSQLQFLFGPQAEDIKSTALIAISGQGLMGVLAIGSHVPERFNSGMGTEYLMRLGEIVSKTLEVVSEPGI